MPWAWALERLEQERSYWIATVTSGGRPHTRPVWGALVDGTVFLSVGAAGFRKGEDRREISLHVDSADNVVILDGVAERVTDPVVRSHACSVFNPKYDLAADSQFVNFQVVPRVAWGWRDGDTNTATKWTFEAPRPPVAMMEER